MEFSLALFGVGFLTTVLGSVMLYLSLRREPEEPRAQGWGILSEPIDKIRASRKLILFMFALGAVVTVGIVAVTLLGWIRW